MSEKSEVKASIIAIGDELISGKTTDRNSGFIARALNAIGVSVIQVSLTGDDEQSVERELRRVAADSNLVITTGGLGPTTDDITRQAIAQACGKELKLDERSLNKIKSWFANRSFTEINVRQAFFPEGAAVIENEWGTADAFETLVICGAGPVPVISLPGVPSEAEALMKNKIIPRLLEKFPGLLGRRTVTCRCFGVSESYIGSCIEQCSLPAAIRVAYRPCFPEIILSFSAENESVQLEDEVARAIAAIDSDFVFTNNAEETLAFAVGRMLEERSITLAAAESCTGGLLASQLVSRPGSSGYLLGSVVAYSNEAKEVFLGVKAPLLETYGAVSSQVALEMARGARIRHGADIAVSITGIAGPGGGTEEKPVGTIWIALVDRELEASFVFNLRWDREKIRFYSTALALDLVRRRLLGLPLEFERK